MTQCSPSANTLSFDRLKCKDLRQKLATSHANLFCVRGGIVQTPPLSAGSLPGITRQVLLELGRKIGVSIVESSLGLEDLYRSDEVFVTSTKRKVQPVGQVEDHRVPQVPGAVTQCLVRAFSDYVGKFCEFRTVKPEDGL